MNVFDLAKIDLGRMMSPATENSSWSRWLYRRVFGRPPAKLSTITYRGRKPPALMATITKNGQYYTGKLPWDMLDKIRVHPIVKLGLIVKSAPIITALREVKIKCEDPKIAAFVKAAFVDRILLQIADQSILMSYIYGVSPQEKVWKSDFVRAVYTDESGVEATAWDGPALIYDKFAFCHPASIDRFIVDPDNNSFDGFVQIPPTGKAEKPVPSDKAFVYPNRPLFGGFWGESELEDIYPYWYYEELFRALQSDFLRFNAIPPIIGYAPPGTRTDDDGNEVDNMEYAGQILERAWESLVVILPFELDDSGRQQSWSYKEMNVGNHSDIYTKGIEELDVMILRGLVVPERTVTQNAAAVGSYNQAEAHAERMLDAGKLETDRILEYINKYAIPQLVEDNFGAEAPACTLYSTGVSEALKGKLHTVVITLLQNDSDGRLARQVAFAELLDYLNIPFKRISDEKLDELTAKPEAAPSPVDAPVEPTPDNSPPADPNADKKK